MLAPQLVEELHVRAGLQPLDVAHAMAEHPQPPLGADARIEQPNAAGGDVAGVGKRRLSLLFLFLVKPHQVGIGHVDLAADFQCGRDVVADQVQGHIADGA